MDKRFGFVPCDEHISRNGTLLCTQFRRAAAASLTEIQSSCGQDVENYEYELPSDFEDEEIDEDAAFTEEDKKQYAGWFEGTEAALASNGRRAADDGLLDSEDDEDGDEEGYNTDDFSAEVGLRPIPVVFHKCPQWYSLPQKTLCIACCLF